MTTSRSEKELSLQDIIKNFYQIMMEAIHSNHLQKQKLESTANNYLEFIRYSLGKSKLNKQAITNKNDILLGSISSLNDFFKDKVEQGTLNLIINNIRENNNALATSLEQSEEEGTAADSFIEGLEKMNGPSATFLAPWALRTGWRGISVVGLKVTEKVPEPKQANPLLAAENAITSARDLFKDKRFALAFSEYQHAIQTLQEINPKLRTQIDNENIDAYQRELAEKILSSISVQIYDNYAETKFILGNYALALHELKKISRPTNADILKINKLEEKQDSITLLEEAYALFDQEKFIEANQKIEEAAKSLINEDRFLIDYVYCDLSRRVASLSIESTKEENYWTSSNYLIHAIYYLQKVTKPISQMTNLSLDFLYRIHEQSTRLAMAQKNKQLDLNGFESLHLIYTKVVDSLDNPLERKPDNEQFIINLKRIKAILLLHGVAKKNLEKENYEIAYKQCVQAMIEFQKMVHQPKSQEEQILKVKDEQALISMSKQLNTITDSLILKSSSDICLNTYLSAIEYLNVSANNLTSDINFIIENKIRLISLLQKRAMIDFNLGNYDIAYQLCLQSINDFNRITNAGSNENGFINQAYNNLEEIRKKMVAPTLQNDLSTSNDNNNEEESYADEDNNSEESYSGNEDNIKANSSTGTNSSSPNLFSKHKAKRTDPDSDPDERTKKHKK